MYGQWPRASFISETAFEWLAPHLGSQPVGHHGASRPASKTLISRIARPRADNQTDRPLGHPEASSARRARPTTAGPATEKSGGLGNLMIGSSPGSACWNRRRAFGRSRTSEAGPLPCYASPAPDERHCPNLPTFLLPALALLAVLFVGRSLKKSSRSASRTLIDGLVWTYRPALLNSRDSIGSTRRRLRQTDTKQMGQLPDRRQGTGSRGSPASATIVWPRQ